MLIQQEFAQRRKQLIDKMRSNSIAIVFAAPRYFRNGNTAFPYRQSSNFYYLTGFEEPKAVAVFVKGATSSEYILFNRPKNPVKEQWFGLRAGQKKAVEEYGADRAYVINEIDTHMLQLFNDVQHIYYIFNCAPQVNFQINKWIDAFPKKQIINLETILHEMRLIKSPAEIQLLKQAAQITSRAYLKIMQQCKPEMYEYELLAKLLHEFYLHGIQAMSFPPIVASGANGCILHYETHGKQIDDGDLVLLDSGCEYKYYAADITRTFPANGKFSEQQALLYNVVLLAQQKAIEQIKPGNSWHQAQEVAVRIITEGLCNLGILTGNVDDLIAQEAYKPFYMHKVSHWLGMDAHDVGAYKINDEWRKLQPGMVLTVEPGIYIAKGMQNVDEKWWGIGIRIEDDLLVTADGHENFTGDVPKTIEDIENIKL